MRTITILFSVLIFCIGNPITAQVEPGSVIEENLDAYLATPTTNHVKEIPVVVIRYLPTIDGYRKGTHGMDRSTCLEKNRSLHI